MRRCVRVALALAVAAVVADCGSVASYDVGGTVSGLVGSGLVVGSGSDSVAIAAGATSFTLPKPFASGSAYSVTVVTQPAGQTCTVTNGTGVVDAANVTTVLVSCRAGVSNQWVWQSGSDTAGAAGVYGSQGTAAPENFPGARWGVGFWVDATGSLWVFGGVGGNLAGSGYLNDLWQYSPGTNEWAWVGGSQALNVAGSYGTQGTAAAGNTPGARAYAATWSDAAGNLWLFGGWGYDASGTLGELNDLWKFSRALGQWQWVSGSNTVWVSGQTPPSSAPGGRESASSWSDVSGDFWLFGGLGANGRTNDLWKYDPPSGAWALVSGSQTAVNTSGVYGTEGMSSATNLPGARQNAVAGTDGSGNVWMFGGYGYDSTGTAGALNDLWTFNTSSSRWVWVSGAETVNAAGVYTAAVPVPGARTQAAGGLDHLGNLWVFGGQGYDSADNVGALNDLWVYSVNTGSWSWVSGAQTSGYVAGVYGSEGVPAAGNTPGPRGYARMQIDSAGKPWMFGGDGSDATNTVGTLGDLWEFLP